MKSTWADAYAVNFHRLQENEIVEFERELLADADLTGLKQPEIYAAVIALRRSESFAGFKPTPYDLKKQIIRTRLQCNDPVESFDFGLALKTLRGLSDPTARFEWIADHTSQSIDGGYIAEKLYKYCEDMPGGIERYKTEHSGMKHNDIAKKVQAPSEVDWAKKKQEAHDKLEKIK